MNAKFLKIGVLFCFLAVVLGAFGAHALKAVLDPDRLNSFETGVRYQFYHGFALLLTAIMSREFDSVWLKRAGYFFTFGIIFFSGSIYLLACRQILGIETWTWLGPITPIGGILFMAAWMMVFWAVFRDGRS